MSDDRYDPTGEVAIWQEAANMVAALKTDTPPSDPDAWNAAIDQAARLLERRGREIRQDKGGMYYRPLTGS